MHQDPKILKERKQSLTKFHQQGSGLGNTMNSITRDRQSSNGRIRSTSTLPKNYNHDLLTNEGCLDRTPSVLGFGVQIKNNSIKQPRLQGADLVAWGQLHLADSEYQQAQPAFDAKTILPVRKIATSAVKFSLGDKHIVYVNNRNEAYGTGSSLYGQLGYKQSPGCQISDINTHLPILEQLLIENVFCTPFCTFLVTNRDEVYACGLNNRGQLGMVQSNSEHSSVFTPTKILSLSKKLILSDPPTDNKIQKHGKKMKATKIQSYALAERNIHNNFSNQSKLLTQKSQGSQIYLETVISHGKLAKQWMSGDANQAEDETLLDEGQFITNITGGPYHSIALSSKGRVFYSGSIYKKSAILNDEYTTKFTELNLKKIGKVQKIKSGLTCIGLLNLQGSLFLLGAINENIICDDPYNIGISNIVDFAIAKEKIYITTGVECWVIVPHKKNLRTFKANLIDHTLLSPRILTAQCGLDYSLMINQKGQLFAEQTSNLSLLGLEFAEKKTIERRIHNHQIDEYEINFLKINTNFKLKEIKCGVNFMLALSDKFLPTQANIPPVNTKENAKFDENKKLKVLENQNEQFKRKLMQLQKQNKILKDLVKDQNSEGKNYRNNSIKKKDLGGSNNLGDKQNVSQQLKKSNNDNVGSSKFDLNSNLGEKIVSKARKFDGSMEIPFEELELGKQISEGGYGVIYKATWRKTTVAVKIFKIDINSQNSIKDFISECHAMEALRHPNIVMFLGACTKPPNFAIVLEYCEGGTLWSILQKNGELSWQLRRRFALDTARAMNYLHERSTPILHRDLKSLNLLLDENKRIKLADFGWTKGLQNYMTGKIGTYQWMAPEVVSSHQYTEKADVFSFGIILWEIASRQAPYRNIPGAQVAQDVLNKDLRPICPKKTPEPFSSLMKRCWAKLPENRPSFSNIIQELQKMQLGD